MGACLAEIAVLLAAAPCGLSCWTCVAHFGGVIGELSRRLTEYLEGFAALAEQFASFVPAYKEYPAFADVLAALSGGTYEGCRSGKRMMAECPIAMCTEERTLTYCSDCADFPCGRADALGDSFRAKWTRNIARLKELGPEAYLDEINQASHYG